MGLYCLVYKDQGCFISYRQKLLYEATLRGVLEPSCTSVMKLFPKNSDGLLAFTYFRKKYPSWMFNWCFKWASDVVICWILSLASRFLSVVTCTFFFNANSIDSKPHGWNLLCLEKSKSMSEQWMCRRETRFQGTYKRDGPTTERDLHSEGFLWHNHWSICQVSEKNIIKVRNDLLSTQAKFSKQLTFLSSGH